MIEKERLRGNNMSGGYVEDYGKVYGCFSCGEVMGEFTVADDGHYMCSHCGEPSVITLQTALDTMIKLQREGQVFVSDYYDEDDPEAEVDFAPTDEFEDADEDF